MLVDKQSCYIIVGKTILSKIEIKSLPEAVVAFMGTFYLLDFDHPKFFEIGLNVLQYFIFQDSNVPKDIAQTFNMNLAAYKKYKSQED